MKLTVTRIDLPLKHPFTIARETTTMQASLIVELQHDGVCGYGEVTENAFYGHTYESIMGSLQRIRPASLQRYVDEKPLDLWAEMRDDLAGDMFALSALDMAAHDLRGKRLGIPTWQDWGLQWSGIPDSSFTIGIDSIDRMVEKLQEEAGWSTYKIKLGTPQDIEIVAELRRHTEAAFRVDANCAWTADETIANSLQLAELGVEYIEQPLPVESSTADKIRVFRESSLPIFADEDCQVTSDIDRCSGIYHGVNVKICKCGGLSPALQMLTHARDLGLKTMVGCMVESSIGISGAAQLLPLLDYADLDGAVLLADEPCRGVTVTKGKVALSQLSGCGGDWDRDRLSEFVSASQKVVQ
ncbi:L-Ala-D/L-Glu epimerase [Rubripirellula lacrimiformis]|uniref:Dipeptide epimerase n=1 Tax=Rubripirellula lacrimiformis TaxID=1930273 RepID=A0A517N4L6_9BACT|nr:dipeptide epimerase [Rubripirellula lacrimiformis]QDT02071.1 L-Ala-D/L-Glu epimerase [Rubripirellula lacrimiformis]